MDDNSDIFRMPVALLFRWIRKVLRKSARRPFRDELTDRLGDLLIKKEARLPVKDSLAKSKYFFSQLNKCPNLEQVDMTSNEAEPKVSNNRKQSRKKKLNSIDSNKVVRVEAESTTDYPEPGPSCSSSSEPPETKRPKLKVSIDTSLIQEMLPFLRKPTARKIMEPTSSDIEALEGLYDLAVTTNDEILVNMSSELLDITTAKSYIGPTTGLVHLSVLIPGYPASMMRYFKIKYKYIRIIVIEKQPKPLKLTASKDQQRSTGKRKNDSKVPLQSEMKRRRPRKSECAGKTEMLFMKGRSASITFIIQILE